MKCDIVPTEVTDLARFSSISYSSYVSEDAENVFGGISKNGLWMWIVHDTVVDIYNTENSEWCGGHCFAKSLKNPSAIITTAVEFNSSHVLFPCLLLAVTQDHESLICMFDARTSQVVRSVLVPVNVTSLEVVDGNGGACVETHFLNPVIRCMFGAIAIGSINGQKYFLDLCLDEDFFCDEKLPNITCFIKKEEFSPQKRERVISKNQHVFICLNDKTIGDGCFEFQSRGNSLSKIPNDYVFVTALKYIRSSATLAVGFNFGGIQLWNLHDLSLQFSIANGTPDQPTVSFAFQEPENDPRNFCYLWIIKGPLKDKQRPQDISVATLYSLTYFKREYVDSFGFLYIELRSCNKRFEYPMTNDPFMPLQLNPSFGTRLLSCEAVSQTDFHHVPDAVSGNESDCSNENMSLCYISWEVWSHSNDYPSAYHMILFDINQWYQAQMPFYLKCDRSTLSPYFGIFSLKEIKCKLDSNAMLGLHVIPRSIKKFKYTTVAEEFFYPSSLGFQTISFSESGICKGTYFGFQRQLLLEMVEQSPQVVINPKEIYSSLIMSGLITDIHGGADRVPLISQREMLMQLALEYNMTSFFMKCLEEWRCSDSVHEGCTSKAILNWTWKKLISVKSSIDKMSVSLFNCSGSDIDKLSLKYLCNFRRQLDLIDTILTTYQKYSMPLSEIKIQELQCRKNVVASISIYLQVLLWLRSVHILPEVCEGEETDKNVLYPANNLAEIYNNRRRELQNIHSSIGPTDILLIDGLVKETVASNTWQEKGGTDTYPPPSIYAALSCYLLAEIPLEVKHALMYYVLQDICHCPSNSSNPLISEIKKFPSVFLMSQSVAKLIEAYWSLDHKDFESAIKKMFHPVVKSSDIFPWQHYRVIKSFLYQHEPQKALRYINFMEPPENTLEDMKLHLSVLISHGAIDLALDYQRSRQCGDYSRELLNHLFLGCKETRRLKDLMYLPLNVCESSSLAKFLSENEDPCAQEALVMYHLLRCNFFDAVEVNEKLSVKVQNKTIPSNERTVDRNALVERMMIAVPKAEKNLIEEIKHLPVSVPQKEDLVQPFSVNVTCRSFKEISYSDFLHSLMFKASAAITASYMEPKTPLRTRNKFTFDEIPLVREPVTPQTMKLSPETKSSFNFPKRTLSPSNLNEFSSPTKKSRLLDNVSFKSTPVLTRRVPKYLIADVASLLQSPPIHRRNSRSFSDTTKQSTPKAAPQSILKKSILTSITPQPDFYNAETPTSLSETDEKSEEEEEGSDALTEINEIDDAEEVPSRQIRFSVPVTDPSSLKVEQSLKPSSLKSSEKCVLESSVAQSKVEAMDTSEHQIELSGQKYFFANISSPKLTREPLKSYVKDVSRTYSPQSLQVEDSESITDHSIDKRSNKSNLHNPEKIFSEVHKSINEEKLEKDSSISHPQASVESYSASISVKVVGSECFEKDESKISACCAENDPDDSSCFISADESSPIISPRKPIRPNQQNMSLEVPLITEQHEATMSSFQDVADKDSSALGEVHPDMEDSMNQSSIKTALEASNAVMKDQVIDYALKETIDSPIKEPSNQNPVNVCYADNVSVDALVSEASNFSSIKVDSEVLRDSASHSTKESSDQNSGKTVEDMTYSDKVSISCSDANAESSKDSADKNYRRVSFITTRRKDLHTETQMLLKELDKLCNQEQNTDFDIKTKRQERKRYTFTSRISSKSTNTDSNDFVVDSGAGDFSSKGLNVEKACSLPVCDETYEEFSHALQKENIEDFPDQKHSQASKSSPRVEVMLKSSPFEKTNQTSFAFSNPVATVSHELTGGTETVTETISFKFSEQTIENTAIKDNELKLNFKMKEKLEGNTHVELSKMSENNHKTYTVSQQDMDSSVPLPKTSERKSSKATKKTSTKKKGKHTSKIEFSFSEPHSPADPKILEALASPPESPVPTFMFSPPLTRGRLRQKTLDGTLNSSALSEMSFSKPKGPPVDPLLESIMNEKALSIQPEDASFKKPKASTKKTPTKKSRVQQKQSASAVANSSSSFLEPIQESYVLKTPKDIHKYSTRHSMVLRQSMSGHKDHKPS